MRKLSFLALFVLCLLAFPQGTKAQIIVLHPISCTGSTDGELAVVANFGTGPYTYNWSTGDVTPTVTNLVAGVYSVTVTDALSTAMVYTETLTDPLALTISLVAQTDVSCTGASTGAVDVTVAGGTGNYWYSWNSGANTEDISNIPAGIYTLIATDQNGCTATAAVTITEPVLALQVTATSVNVACYGANTGSATANPVGGTGAYSYLWNSGAVTSTINGLSAGNYSVTVTDANLCTSTAFVTVDQPLSSVQATLTQTNVSCFGGNDGIATVTNASGGTGTLTYLWSTGAVTSQITGLTAGNYSVTITDANGCQFIGTTTIIQPTALTVTLATQTNVSCFGSSTGAINVNVNGGTLPYLYNWSNGAVSQDISNVPAGTYTLVVTDANGCTIVYNRTIAQPATAVSVSATSTNVSCFGGNDGTVTAVGVGGIGALAYLWSNGAITPNITNVVAGNYSVTVTDANGCTASSSVVITQPATPVQVFPLWDNVTCNGGNDGTATAIGVGGTGFLMYLWNTGMTTSAVSNLVAGNYSVTVTDANGCTAIGNVPITEPATPVAVTFMTTIVTCNGGNDASATALGSGGTGVLHYLWSTGEITPTIIGLAAGNYFVTVTDANSCSIIGNIVITQPAPISIIPTITPSDCDGHNTGAISLIVNGGTMPYVFSWQEVNFDSTYTTQNLLNVRGGTYALMITDANGCTYLDTLVVPNLATVATNIVPTSYVCNGSQGSVSINALLADSAYYFTYAWNSAYTNGSFTTNDSVFNSSPAFVAGHYSITVTDNQTGCVAYYDGVMSQSSAPLVVNYTVTHNTCYENAAGSIHLSASGGDPKPGYHITWTGPHGYTSTAFSIGGLVSGDYSYTVTDDSVCSVSGTIRIEPLLPIQGYVTSENILCNGGNTGAAEAFYSGGTGVLHYLWNTGASTPFITNLPVGTYTLTVTDSVGCFVVDSVVIGQPSPVIITLDSISNVSCYGGNDGGIWITTNGGTGVLSYTWLHDGTLFSQVTEDIFDVPAGVYQVSVFDTVGCLAQAIFTVNQPMQTTFVDSVHTISCNNGSDGYWQIEPIGPDFPYVAIFSTGDTISTDTVPAPFISGLSAGNYSVTFTSVIGCSWTFTLFLEQPLPITVGTVNIIPVNCYGDSTGSITLDAVHGGTSPYTFVWNNGAITQNIAPIPSGIYNLTITDALGCNIFETYEVEQPFEPIKFFPQITSTVCQQSEDGQVVLYAEDIYWSPYQNTFYVYDSLGVLVDSVPPGQIIGNLPPGPYIGILINEYGCSAMDSLYVGKGQDNCILIPNLVTINDDGYNDVFKVQGGCEYDTFVVEIFTDWGEQVFESSDCAFIWNPKDNKATPNSVYYYYIKVTENGKTYEFKSSINIQK